MKRNNLTTALIAGIAGVAGIASVSTAVNLNSDGTGQLLIYPYYTVNNGLNTLISVVNTTDKSKAIKVRFLEGKNSRECLDFNLYLSAYDVWTAALIPTTATSLFSPGHEGENTVKLITSDTSCVDPSVISATGYEFLPYGYDPGNNGSAASGYDEQGLDLQRCTEGHFEMIDMGDITDIDTIDGIDHGTTGIPADCSVVVNNFNPGEIWNTIPISGIDASSGGIFGSASIVDVAGGTDVAYNADAIDAFTTIPLITNTGDLLPSLNSGGELTSNIFYNGTVITDTWNVQPIQAVSAVYMHDSIFGEYALEDVIGANTEWVVTFPTKNFYVDSFRNVFGAGNNPYQPFTQAIDDRGIGACEVYTFEYYDREEQVPDARIAQRPPSPRPPGVDNGDAVFCWETNVVEFNDSDVLSGDSLILGSKNTTHFITANTPAQAATATTPAVSPTYFDTGWVAMHFAQSTNDNGTGNVYDGLPVTGFATQRYVNANLTGGILANYAGLFAHRYSRSIHN